MFTVQFLGYILNEKLTIFLDSAKRQSVMKKLQHLQLQRDLEEASAILEKIPPDVLKEYTAVTRQKKEVQITRDTA